MKGELPPKRPHEPAKKQHSRQAGIPGITPQQVEAQPWLDELNQDVVIPLDGAEAILTETCGLGQNL